ncbi:histidine kinase [Lentzea jiangxiensis]|uniref:Na+/proline symporter n=1 Tax=Lentzea jiangxiensis TaxID=641025 RepID=A0A1H0X7G6_9PSEU|nr:histidine kinase [Lentzea jiangxiensis]SDP98840.1 Na+/proline symporter [Lentzea jiangxiensis]
MLPLWVVVTVAVLYLGALFVVAYYADLRAQSRGPRISHSIVYSLSLTVFATSWTYYGSVGRAATSGMSFLPIYLGPTLMFAFGWIVLRRIIRISKRDRITSLADFVSARYGKSSLLGGLVTVVAVVAVIPYIALQLKAVSATFELITGESGSASVAGGAHSSFLTDTGFYIAVILAGFTVLFGTRQLDATERHAGMMAAIAVESVVKLVAFVALGIYVTFVLFDGFGDLFTKAAERNLTQLSELGMTGPTWSWTIVLAGVAVLLLPRQWQVAVVENLDERHLKRATWMFPLYLLLINIFVLPIAAAGLLTFGDGVDADTYVLNLPMAHGQETLTVLVFIGGLAAATGMVIVETIALSTMVSNSVLLPLLLRLRPSLARRGELALPILLMRRATIAAVMLLGYMYCRAAGSGAALASIGLVSFAGVAQLAPAVLGALFWRGGSRRGVFAGLLGGFVVWAYTLLIPTFTDAGIVDLAFLRDGPFGIEALRPYALFGMTGMEPVVHSLFWSMLVNLGAFLTVSLLGRTSAAECAEAVVFVDGVDSRRTLTRRSPVTVRSLRDLLERFVGRTTARKALDDFADQRAMPLALGADAPNGLVEHVESVLAGSVGTASARILVSSVVSEEKLTAEEIIDLLDEASQFATLEERHRLARELHDSVSQALFSMTLHTRAVELAVVKEGNDPEGAVVQGLAELRSLTQGALAEMRAALFQLRPDALHEDGLVQAIRQKAKAIAAREGIDVHVDTSHDRLELDERSEAELFRVVQEAAYNSVKHADPTRIDIRIHRKDGHLVVEVTDDGKGFDTTGTFPGHLGLGCMRERITKIGGELTITSPPEGSTTVRAVVPNVFV